MKSSRILLSLLFLLLGSVLGYIMRGFAWELLYRDMLRSHGDTWGFYKVFDHRKEDTTNSTSDSAARWGVKGLAYCQFIAEDEMQLPQELLGGYMKIGNKVVYEGNVVTTCEDCQQINQIPFLLFDGEKSYYQGKVLSGFNYSTLKVLDFSLPIFTDMMYTYYQEILLTGFDYSTFSMINSASQTFGDKDYIYTFDQDTQQLRVELASGFLL